MCSSSYLCDSICVKAITLCTLKIFKLGSLGGGGEKEFCTGKHSGKKPQKTNPEIKQGMIRYCHPEVP